MTVDILCAVHNGDRYLDDLFRSLQAQRVPDWRCWVRDDGSTDASAGRVEAWAKRDPRITLLHKGPPALGGAGAGSYGWLIERLPADARIVCLADHDDVWLPDRLERSLAALADAERAQPGPILVHTDLEVVDDRLETIHSSFWQAAELDVTRADTRRIAVDNVVTTSTITMNRALIERLGPRPPAAVRNPDAWFALAAAAFGRIVALPVVTVRYRQHGANAVGALERAQRAQRSLLTAIRRGIATRREYRRDLEHSCALAQAFVDRFGDALTASDRLFLEAYGALPRHSALARKLGVLRLRRRPGRTVLAALGEFLRA